MASFTIFALSLALTVEAAPKSGPTCADSSVMLQVGVINDEIKEEVNGIATAVEAVGSAAKAEAGKMEQSLRSVEDANKLVQAAKQTTDAAVGFEAQASDSLKLAYQEAQQAEKMQEARALEESNVTSLLHSALLDVEKMAPEDGHSNAIYKKLQAAEVAQAKMLMDASQQDQALTGLSNTMATAAQAATTAKLVGETQISQSIDKAVAKLQAVQGIELAGAKDSIKLAKSMQGLDAKQTLQLLQSSVDKERAAEDKERAAKDEEHKQKLAALQAQVSKANSEKAAGEAAVAEAHKQLESSLLTVQKLEEQNREGVAERQKAEEARQQAAAMYKAATTAQAALERQVSRTEEKLLRVSVQASQAAKQLQGAAASGSTMAPISPVKNFAAPQPVQQERQAANPGTATMPGLQRSTGSGYVQPSVPYSAPQPVPQQLLQGAYPQPSMPYRAPQPVPQQLLQGAYPGAPQPVPQQFLQGAYPQPSMPYSAPRPVPQQLLQGAYPQPTVPYSAP